MESALQELHGMSQQVLTFFFFNSCLATSRLLLGGRVTIDILLLRSTLARRCLRNGISIYFVALVLRSNSLLSARSLLWSMWNSAVGSRSYQLDFDLGPGVAGRARVAHASKGSKLIVVDLFMGVSMVQGQGKQKVCLEITSQSPTSGGPDLSDCIAQPRS